MNCPLPSKMFVNLPGTEPKDSSRDFFDLVFDTVRLRGRQRSSFGLLRAVRHGTVLLKWARKETAACCI